MEPGGAEGVGGTRGRAILREPQRRHPQISGKCLVGGKGPGQPRSALPANLFPSPRHPWTSASVRTSAPMPQPPEQPRTFRAQTAVLLRAARPQGPPVTGLPPPRSEKAPPPSPCWSISTESSLFSGPCPGFSNLDLGLRPSQLDHRTEWCWRPHLNPDLWLPQPEHQN